MRDWRRRADYADLYTYSRGEIAFEFLRRNPEYSVDFSEAARRRHLFGQFLSAAQSEPHTSYFYVGTELAAAEQRRRAWASGDVSMEVHAGAGFFCIPPSAPYETLRQWDARSLVEKKSGWAEPVQIPFETFLARKWGLASPLVDPGGGRRSIDLVSHGDDVEWLLDAVGENDLAAVLLAHRMSLTVEDRWSNELFKAQTQVWARYQMGSEPYARRRRTECRNRIIGGQGNREEVRNSVAAADYRLRATTQRRTVIEVLQVADALRDGATYSQAAWYIFERPEGARYDNALARVRRRKDAAIRLITRAYREF